jgi:hypothetical protein
MQDYTAYDQGYRQALEDVAKLIKTSPVPDMAESNHKQDFWLLMRKLPSNDKNKWAIFSGGYRVALKELSQRVLSLSKNI